MFFILFFLIKCQQNWLPYNLSAVVIQIILHGSHCCTGSVSNWGRRLLLHAERRVRVAHAPSLPPSANGSSHDLECCDIVLENREALDHRHKYTIRLFCFSWWTHDPQSEVVVQIYQSHNAGGKTKGFSLIRSRSSPVREQCQNFKWFFSKLIYF